ncbi:MAG: PH domain-containing protein [Planctomycetaceae bacterium]|nr:PH domain-containing protein [Planctomycetaceae bacterium]
MSTAVEQIAYECPHCQTAMHIDEDIVGEVMDCPNCDKPFRVKVPEATPVSDDQLPEDAPDVASAERDEKDLVSVHPSMFRAHPIRFLGESAMMLVGFVLLGMAASGQLLMSAWLQYTLGGLLAVAGAGLMTYWWLTIIYTTLSVTNNRSLLRHGIFARYTTEVRHDDVRNIQVEQNIYQRVVGIGDIAISSAGQDDLEVDANGIPRPKEIAETVRELQ